MDLFTCLATPEISAQLAISGIAVGMIYSVIAFGYQLTFATSKTLNFGQGEALMLGAFVGLTLAPIIGYLAVIPAIAIFGMIQGAVVERLGVRPALKDKTESGWIMATIALGIIFKNLAENIWGRNELKFPSPLPETPISVAGINMLPMEIVVVIGALLMMLAVEVFNRRSIYGKAVVATSADPGAAGLVGINTALVVTFSYALSSATAAIAGVLVGPLTPVGSSIGAILGLKAFAVAIIGGLNSGLGVIVGGLILGISEKLTAGCVSSGYQNVPGLVLLLLVLSFKPAGLFGKTAIKKV